MRHRIRWRTTAVADVEIELDELASWAVRTGLVRTHAPGERPQDAVLAILDRNPHARAQLLRAWAEAHGQPLTIERGGGHPTIHQR